MQCLLPDDLEIAGERLPLPVVADDLQTGSVRLAEERREHLVRRTRPWYKGAISGCWIVAVPSNARMSLQVSRKWASGMCQWQSSAVSSSYRPRWIRSPILSLASAAAKLRSAGAS